MTVRDTCSPHLWAGHEMCALAASAPTGSMPSYGTLSVSYSTIRPLLPHLHQSWAQTKQHDLTALTAQQTQLQHRNASASSGKVERLLDAYQTEIITLSELQLRRQKLTTELHQLDRELQQLTHTQQQTLHWQDVIDHVEHFRHLLGEQSRSPLLCRSPNRCPMSDQKSRRHGEQVDISYILPFDQAPQVYNSSDQPPEGTIVVLYTKSWLATDGGVMTFDTHLTLLSVEPRTWTQPVRGLTTARGVIAIADETQLYMYDRVLRLQYREGARSAERGRVQLTRIKADARGEYLYLVDEAYHRILRYQLSTRQWVSGPP